MTRALDRWSDLPEAITPRPLQLDIDTLRVGGTDKVLQALYCVSPAGARRYLEALPRGYRYDTAPVRIVAWHVPAGRVTLHVSGATHDVTPESAKHGPVALVYVVGVRRVDGSHYRIGPVFPSFPAAVSYATTLPEWPCA